MQLRRAIQKTCIQLQNEKKKPFSFINYMQMQTTEDTYCFANNIGSINECESEPKVCGASLFKWNDYMCMWKAINE